MSKDLPSFKESIQTIEEVRRHTKTALENLQRMQDVYLDRNSGLYSDSQVCQIKRSFKAVKYKFFLTCFHLEQLWTLSMDSRFELLDAIANSLDRLSWDKTQSFIGSVLLESFLFQARSLLDVFMFYICLVMGIENPGKMTKEKFYKKMKHRKGTPFEGRATDPMKYFKERVFGEGRWGKLLEDLRDRIAHWDIIRPSFEGKEALRGILLDWPTLREMTYDRFCQFIGNGLFEMFREMSQLLFELKWKSGPYRNNLWE